MQLFIYNNVQTDRQTDGWMDG